MNATESFLQARDFLIDKREDYAAAYAGFRWPRLSEFNWALDYFDRHGARQLAHRAVGRGRGRLRGEAELRRDERALQPGGELPARERREARRLHAGHAAERGAAVGDHARGDETRRAGEPGHHAAHPGRPRRPHRARQHPPRGRRRGREPKIRRPAGQVLAHPGGRRSAGLDAVPAGRFRRRRLRARGRDPRRRSLAALLHLGHHREAEDGAAHAPELPGRPPVDHVLARPARRRRALQHQLAGLGQARLELLVRAVERGRDDLSLQPRALRRARRRSTRWCAMASPPCARRPPCGAC